MADKLPASRSSGREIEAFLDRAAKIPSVAQAKGRLVFAIDATMSRGLTWGLATEIQSEMFEVAESVGGIAVQLVWFRGRGEFKATQWTAQPAILAQHMREVSCVSGFTQLRRVLAHVATEASHTRVGAFVYVGDACEEDPAVLYAEAGRLALLGVPAFMFHEGRDGDAANVFSEIARVTRGVFSRFDSSAPETLRRLLRAAAVYAAGGMPALKDYGERAGGEIRQIARNMSGTR
jgi:hypothetical protein